MSTYQTNLMMNESSINRDISYIQTMEETINLTHCQNIVYNIIRSHSKKGGMTDQGIAQIADMPLSSVNARRNELVKMGLVCSNGSIDYYDDYGRQRYRTLWIKI